MKAFPLLVALSLSVPTSAQDATPCAYPEARAFDFWLGDWRIEQEILQRDGSWLPLEATTSVALALDGCALVEHWEGEVLFFWEGMEAAAPMKGLSVRAFDPRTGQWHIHWMDTRSPVFGGAYTGGFAEGRGTFFRAWETPQGKRRGRITFSDVTPDSVRWELAVSSDDGQTWSPLWIMTMHRTGR